MLFSCERGTYVWGKLHEGTQIWVAQQAPSTDWAPPPSKQCKHGKEAAHGSVFIGEKTEKLNINPQHRAEQFPNNLYVSGELFWCTLMYCMVQYEEMCLSPP